MVRPVRIHDRQPLHPAILRPGFGDIGDPAVEERVLAREARIDEVSALVRGAAPVGGGHLPGRAGQLLLQRDVIEIAADQQLVALARADKALNQHFRAAARPGLIGRRAHFLIGRAWQGFGADRLEQAIVLEVGGDDLREAGAKRGGRAGAGRGRHVGIGGKGRDGDAQILPVAVIGDFAGQPFFGRGIGRYRDGRLRGRGRLLRHCGRRQQHGEGEQAKTVHCDNFLSKRNSVTRFQAE